MKKRTWYFVVIAALACSVAMLSAFPALASSPEIYYLGGGGYADSSETVTYDSVDYSESYQINSKIPTYCNNDTSKTNTCAPVAASAVVGYYDRWFSNMIADYEAGHYIATLYRYYNTRNNTQIQAAINELYNKMGTNVDHLGTTQQEFKDGLEEYAEVRGHNITYTDVASSGSINLSALDAQLRSGNVVVLCCTKYNFVDYITNNSGSTYISRRYSVVPHMMVAYGYTVYKYYRSGSLFRTDLFLDIASCTNEPTLTQIQVNKDITMENAFAVNIY